MVRSRAHRLDRVAQESLQVAVIGTGLLRLVLPASGGGGPMPPGGSACNGGWRMAPGRGCAAAGHGTEAGGVS